MVSLIVAGRLAHADRFVAFPAVDATLAFDFRDGTVIVVDFGNYEVIVVIVTTSWAHDMVRIVTSDDASCCIDRIFLHSITPAHQLFVRLLHLPMNQTINVDIHDLFNRSSNCTHYILFFYFHTKSKIQKGFLPRDALQCKARSCCRLSSVRLSVCRSVRL